MKTINQENNTLHWVLTDLDHGIHLGAWQTTQRLGATPVSVQQRRLQGGLQQGVDVLEITAGEWSVSVLPTRGMGLWRAQWGNVPLAWSSPVRGPVHPRFVPLYDPSGLGWLDGFDEFVVRCGLHSNGAPDFDDQGRLQFPLHGRIANQPAHYVAVALDPQRRAVVVTGIVEEARFHFQKLRLTTQWTIFADEPALELNDRVENYGGSPTGCQLLYHNNVGPPLLGPGSRIVAAVQELAPRDEHAARDTGTWDQFGPAVAGGSEQVYLMRLASDDRQQTRVVVTAPDQQQGFGVKYRVDQLPCFTLWKNAVDCADGYVVGLEPGTNFPNPRSFEEQHGRVVVLDAGDARAFDVRYEVYPEPTRLQAATESVAALQATVTPTLHDGPTCDWCAP